MTGGCRTFIHQLMSNIRLRNLFSCLYHELLFHLGACYSPSNVIFFCFENIQTLKEFLVFAEAEVRSLTSLYSGVVRHSILLSYFRHLLFVMCFQDEDSYCLNISEFGFVQGRNADALALYFGEDPARCPFEQGIFGQLVLF